MIRNTLFVLSVFIAFAFSGAWANPVTPQTALQTANAFLAKRGIRAPMTLQQSVTRAASGTRVQEQKGYYVFNAGAKNGFVIVSGSDRTAPILGYSDSGTFDEDNLNPNTKAWLSRYADEIKYLESHPSPAYITPQAARHPVLPFIKSHWNQDAPYNLKCPDNGVTVGQKSVTGCVATAIAQVMYYYKYPNETATDIPGYGFNQNGTWITLPGYPKGTKIAWDDMTDNYGSASTDAQKNAVADLMLMVGVGVKMDYGPSSGAYLHPDGYTLLKDYMGYDTGVTHGVRSQYSLSDWIQTIYQEMAAARPVVYVGYSSGGGHAFVIDGYDSDDMFHVNWGWGGASDGYYRLTVLQPGANAGIGASSTSDGYAIDQDVLMSIKVPDSAPAADTSTPTLSMYGLKVAGNSISTTYYNYSPMERSFFYGIGIMGFNDVITPLNVTQSAVKFTGYLNKTTPFSVDSLADGTYKIVPICKAVDAEAWSSTLNTSKNFVLAEVKNGVITLSEATGETPELTVKRWDFTGLKVKDVKQEVSVTFENTDKLNDYYSTLYCFASPTQTKGSMASKAGVTVRASQENTATFAFTPSSAGKYNVWICSDYMGTNVIASTTVNIDTARVSKLDISAVKFVNATDGVNYGNDCTISFRLTNMGTGTNNSTVTVNLWRGATGALRFGFYKSQDVLVNLPIGLAQTYTVTFKDVTADNDLAVSFKGGDNTRPLDGSTIYYNWIVTQRAGIVLYRSTGEKVSQAPTETLALNNVCGVDLRGVSQVTRITDNTGNPNLVFALDEGAPLPEGIAASANIIRGTEAEKIMLQDGYPAYFPCDFYAKEIAYVRPVGQAGTASGGWEALSLPFVPTSVTADGTPVTFRKTDGSNASTCNAALKAFDYVDGQGVHFKDVEQLEANIPCVYKLTDARLNGRSIRFEAAGANIRKTDAPRMKAMTDWYVYEGTTYTNTPSLAYYLNQEGTAFVYNSDVQPVDGFHAAFTTSITDGSQAPQIFIEDVSTGIKSIAQAAEGYVPVYNLAGVMVGRAALIGGKPQLESLPKGIYIVGGKKVIR